MPVGFIAYMVCGPATTKSARGANPEAPGCEHPDIIKESSIRVRQKLRKPRLLTSAPAVKQKTSISSWVVKQLPMQSAAELSMLTLVSHYREFTFPSAQFNRVRTKATSAARQDLQVPPTRRVNLEWKASRPDVMSLCLTLQTSIRMQRRRRRSTAIRFLLRFSMATSLTSKSKRNAV